jgi:hypothetical protein
MLPQLKVSLVNSLIQAAWNPYLNIEIYSIHFNQTGIVLVLTKNPPMTMRGMTRTGIRAMASSNLGTNTEISNP